VPITLPENKSWLGWADFSPTIYNGGTFYKTTNNDWGDAMAWLKSNTPEDAVIAAWWDYGYWITTLSDRTTIIDNATLNDWQIKRMAYSFITTPDNAWHILNSHHSEDISEYLDYEKAGCWGYSLDCKIDTNKNDLGWANNVPGHINKGMDADYIIIFLAAESFAIPDSDAFLYLLDGGADESKKTWLIHISNHDVAKFTENDNMTPTSFFMENSTLGKLMPFSIYKYVDFETDILYDEYRLGAIPVYYKDVKFVDPQNDPFYLVYASPTFYSQIPGPMTSVLIYKINPDYQP